MRTILIFSSLIIILLWLTGIFDFLRKIEFQNFSFNESSDGIAVLTGGKGRINLGLELINKHKNIKLIISGVDKKVSMQTILPDNLVNKSEITLDRVSESTFQNAIVISEWIKKNNLTNITVITSYYHIPRTMLLLEVLSPNQNFYPYPVKKINANKVSFKEKFLYYSFLAQEYMKYIFSHIIIIA